MKKLPLLTLLLWLLLLGGYFFVPRIVLHEYVQYPLVVLFSIILPVSLWIAVQDGRRALAAVLAGLFLLNAAVLLFALERNYAAWRMLEQETSKGIHPELAAFLAENPDKGHYAAQHVYQHFGVAVPFVSAKDAFAVFKPEEEDKQAFRENFNKAVAMDVAAMNANTQLLTTFLLLALHAGIFILLLVFLLVYEKVAIARPGTREQAG